MTIAHNKIHNILKINERVFKFNNILTKIEALYGSSDTLSNLNDYKYFYLRCNVIGENKTLLLHKQPRPIDNKNMLPCLYPRLNYEITSEVKTNKVCLLNPYDAYYEIQNRTSVRLEDKPYFDHNLLVAKRKKVNLNNISILHSEQHHITDKMVKNIKSYMVLSIEEIILNGKFLNNFKINRLELYSIDSNKKFFLDFNFDILYFFQTIKIMKNRFPTINIL